MCGRCGRGSGGTNWTSSSRVDQVGAEVIGSHDPDLDTELIALAWRFYARLGLGQVRLVINTLGDKADRPPFLDALTASGRRLTAEAPLLEAHQITGQTEQATFQIGHLPLLCAVGLSRCGVLDGLTGGFRDHRDGHLVVVSGR